MWNVPSYRIRAYLRRNRVSKAPKLNRNKPRLRLLRAGAQIRVIDGLALANDIIPANVILNDLSLRGIFLFSSENLAIGQRVAITIDQPRNFYIRGRVVMCRRMIEAQSPIISEISYSFRVGILFEFRSLEERIAVKKYCDELSTQYLRVATRPQN